MACLDITNGSFFNDESVIWNNSNENITLPNGAVLTSQNGGTNPGISIVKGGSSEFFSKPSSGNVYFVNFGTPKNYIVILTVLAGAGVSTRTVTLVDTSGSSIKTKLMFTVDSSPGSGNLPVITLSKAKGHLFFTKAVKNTGDTTGMIIARSDNGKELCSAVPFSASLEVTAEATTTLLKILHGGNTIKSEPRPAADCDVNPNSKTFPVAVLGAGVDPALSSHIEQFKIKNTGDDCLTINSIDSKGPFSVSNNPFPKTLDPAEEVTVDILFAPTTIDDYAEKLPIKPTPSDGDTELICKGIASPPKVSITFPGSIDFDKVPLGDTDSKTATITNNGEVAVNINIGASPGGIPFSWGAFAGVLATGASHNLAITFAPPTENKFNYSLPFTGSDPDSPHDIDLSGTGCVANAEMQVQVPPGPFIDFGEVGEGFRMVRTITVINNADGPLNFSARIQGGDEDLFGIQKEGTSIINPVSDTSFTVFPTDPCGGTAGAGEVTFGVTFFANKAPSSTPFKSQLIIYGHNATNPIPLELPYDLQALIIETAEVDAALVLDRSGSMKDASGDRVKIDTAIDAGRLFVELLRPDKDRVGIVKFNQTPKNVLEILEITNNNQGLIQFAITPNAFAPNGSTSIAGGVRLANKNIDDNPRPNPPDDLNSIIVVLTDGKDNSPYVDPDDGKTYSLLGYEPGSIPLPAPPKKQLYAVGIGNSVNSAKLGALASITGGEFLHVYDFSGKDFFALEKYFTQIFMEAVNLAVISDPVFTIQPHDKHVNPIDILSGDTGLMIVVYDREFIRLPFYLESPKGEIIELTTVPAGFQIRPGITNTARFIEVKFPKGEPDRYAGVWKFILYHDGKACYYRSPKPTHGAVSQSYKQTYEEFGFGFQPKDCKDHYNKPIMYGFAIGAGSNFRMFPFVQPGIIKVGETIKLNALVSEFGVPVTGCKVTVKVKTPGGTVYNFSMYDDGLHQDDELNDGNYGKVFTNTSEEGYYTFTFRATGYSHDNEPVVREAVRSKHVEGLTPVREDPTTRPVDLGRTFRDCCRRIGYFLLVIIILILILIYRNWLG